MDILSLDGFLASNRVSYSLTRNFSTTAASSVRINVYNATGNISTGTFAGTDRNGTLITGATAGFPQLVTTGSSSGYISGAEYYWDVAGTLLVQDLIMKMGTFAATGDTQAITMPSHSRAYPTYASIGMGLECTSLVSGTVAITINYTDDNNTALATTFTLTGSNIVGRVIQVPLSSNYGVKTVTDITVSGGTTGAFNIILYRDLFFSRCLSNQPVVINNMVQIGFPKIFPDTALNVVCISDGSVTGQPSVTLEVAGL